MADQIVEDLCTQILGGALPDGSRLPSERDLATAYDVSAPTIREAVRVLTAMGLITTRNGSRATVNAQGDTMLAMSIASVVQVEKVGAREVLGLLGALQAYAAELAAEHATDEEIARLRETALAIPGAEGVEAGSAALHHFFATLAEISHNPLLAALCRFITAMQIGLSLKLSGAGEGDWGRVAGDLQPGRMRIVTAIGTRDPAHAAEVVRAYHDRAVHRLGEARRGTDADDSRLTEALGAWLRSNVGLGGQVMGRRDPGPVA
ncbi:GntR family transcriptional regulator [Streptomyces sp. NPDC093252]|uniref:FadR/GntR family transcriptional regulator n=1 Tax=Streptomyces sp. NPDC093252 TaxID=3154980 RepID=UPI003418F5ED